MAVIALPAALRAQEAENTVIDASKFPDLQTALDAVGEAGGIVKLPPGEFRITKPLMLTRRRRASSVPVQPPRLSTRTPTVSLPL